MNKPKKPTKSKPNARRLIATEVMGWSTINLFVDPNERGGSFYSFTPSKKTLPSITVGIGQRSWWQCFAVLEHEVLEALFVQYNVRYQHSDLIGINSADYHFLMDHQQFTEVVSQGAYYISLVYVRLQKAWKDYDTYTRRKKKK